MLEVGIWGLLFISWVGLFLLLHRYRKLKAELYKRKKQLDSSSSGTSPDQRYDLEKIPLPLAVIDRNRQVINANSRFKEFSPVFNLQNILELPFPGVIEFHQRLFSTGRAEVEFPLEKRWYRLWGKKISSEEAFVGFVEITREKLLEERTKTLTATLAHEFRTPLTTIIGYAESLEEYLPEEDFPKKALSALQGQAQRLSRMVRDILFLSSLETGLKLQREPILVKEFLFALRDLVSPLFKKKNLSLEITGDTDFVFIVDKDYLIQAFLKLLENAVRFSPEGETITIEVGREKDKAIFRIKDRGPGIPEEWREKIFEPFFSGERKGGLGLGLPLARRLVEAHEGTLEMEPCSHGASLVVKIPLNDALCSQSGHN